MKTPKGIERTLWKIIQSIRNPNNIYREDTYANFDEIYNIDADYIEIKNVHKYANMFPIGESDINFIGNSIDNCEYVFNISELCKKEIYPTLILEEITNLEEYILNKINIFIETNSLIKNKYLCGEVFLMTDDNDKLFMYFISKCTTPISDRKMIGNIFFPIISSFDISFDFPEDMSLFHCQGQIATKIGNRTAKRLYKEYEINRDKAYIENKKEKIKKLQKGIETLTSSINSINKLM